jgi:hypothetical protein
MLPAAVIYCPTTARYCTMLPASDFYWPLLPDDCPLRPDDCPLLSDDCPQLHDAAR